MYVYLTLFTYLTYVYIPSPGALRVHRKSCPRNVVFLACKQSSVTPTNGEKSRRGHFLVKFPSESRGMMSRNTEGQSASCQPVLSTQPVRQAEGTAPTALPCHGGGTAPPRALSGGVASLPPARAGRDGGAGRAGAAGAR